MAFIALRNLAPAPVGFPTLLRLATVATVYGGLAVFSAMTGFALWSEKREAVRRAKTFLVVVSLVPICLMTALRLGGVNVELFQVIPARLIYLAVWYSYLRVSKRVKATYFA
jgi:hypothetical protein